MIERRGISVEERSAASRGSWVALGALAVVLAVECGTPAAMYQTTDEVRDVLASEDIGCRDSALEDPPEAGALACSFADWTPGLGLVASDVILFAYPADAAEIAVRCSAAGSDGGQLLYREGQNWVAMITPFERDRRTASNIQDQDFVNRVAQLLGADVPDC